MEENILGAICNDCQEDYCSAWWSLQERLRSARDCDFVREETKLVLRVVLDLMDGYEELYLNG